jgi:hypothetical protein
VVFLVFLAISRFSRTASNFQPLSTDFSLGGERFQGYYRPKWNILELSGVIWNQDLEPPNYLCLSSVYPHLGLLKGNPGAADAEEPVWLTGDQNSSKS